MGREGVCERGVNLSHTIQSHGLPSLIMSTVGLMDSSPAIH